MSKVNINETSKLAGMSRPNNLQKNDPKDSYVEMVLLERIECLEALLKAREEELEGHREREKTFYRLLENRPMKKKRWWQFK